MTRRAATAPSLRERVQAQLVDLKMPGALEALDDVLRRCDDGALAPGEAIAVVLGAHIELRNARRLQTAMRSARLPAVKTLPSTVKCSCERSWRASAARRTSWQNASAMCPASRRSRFLVNTVGSHTASSGVSPTNQRKSRL